MVCHSLGGGKPEEPRLTISTRRRYLSERNRPFVQWLFYPVWLLPYTMLANMLSMSIEAILVSAANRSGSIVRDIYFRSQRDPVAKLKAVRVARRTAMRLRAISFTEFFAAFTLVPQKTRILLTSNVPRS